VTTFADQFKSEISRLAKKEVRAETQALKKASSQYRGEIAALKKRVVSLEQQLKMLSKGAGSRKAPEVLVDQGGSTLRFRAEGFASLRKRLGISAADMGRLLGVSLQSVYHWEAGKTRPRASQLAAIATVRKLGKRAVEARLAEGEAE